MGEPAFSPDHRIQYESIHESILFPLVTPAGRDTGGVAKASITPLILNVEIVT